MSATFEQLVVQFTHIIKRVSKTYGLHESHRQVIILQLKGFLDEFCNTKGSWKRNMKRRYSQVPAVRVCGLWVGRGVTATRMLDTCVHCMPSGSSVLSQVAVLLAHSVV